MRALIIDDDAVVAKLTARYLAQWGFAADICDGFAAAQALFRKHHAELDVVLLDQELPEGSGLELLPKLTAINNDIPVIMVTGHGSGELAAAAMKLGAVDFVSKPFQPEHLKNICVTAAERRRLRTHLQKRETPSSGGSLFVSPAMQQLRQLCDRLANLDVNVLITGETGSGKEVAARYLHHASERRQAPFVAVNCAAIPKDLLESELFGFKKGAFTGAEADHPGIFRQAGRGTLFLDEIGEMPLDLQAKLLRVVQDKKVQPLGERQQYPVEARLLSATHVDLAAQIRAGRFREDLFYRLNQFSLAVPPLRDRPEDILPLTQHFLSAAAGNGVSTKGLSQPVLQVLAQHHWPGNVRQLENVILRAAILANGEEVQIKHLPSDLLETIDTAKLVERPETPTVHTALLTADAAAGGPDSIRPLAEVERDAILAAVQCCGGNFSEAAKRLGIGRATLYRKFEAYQSGGVGGDLVVQKK